MSSENASSTDSAETIQATGVATTLKRPNNQNIAGFPALAIQRIRGAQRLNRITIMFIMLALALFIIFGTIASLKMFHSNELLYLIFHYVPYALVVIAIPILLYQTFVVSYYRLSQPSMLVTSVGLASILTLVCLLFQLSNWLWLAMAAWIGVAYWFKATFKRFFKFINAKQNPQ